MLIVNWTLTIIVCQIQFSSIRHDTTGRDVPCRVETRRNVSSSFRTWPEWW